MARLRRSPIGAFAFVAVLAAAFAAPPAAASGNSANAKSHRAPPAASVSHVKNKTAQAMPGPRKPGWVESLIGKLKPRPPGHTCRG